MMRLVITPLTAAQALNRSSSARVRHRITVLITLLTLAAAWLRLSHLGAQSLWLDEGATVAIARASWRHFTWMWWYADVSLQTIYFFFMRGWIQAGLSETWIRLPSALFGIAAVPLLYVVSRKFVAAPAAVAACALLAFSPAHVLHSQDARSYTLTIFLVILSTLFFVCAVERNRPEYWGLWIIVSIAAFYSHDFAAFVLVAQAASLLFKSPPVPWRRVLPGGFVIFVAALPALTYFFRASPENLHSTWRPGVGPREFWRLATFFAGGSAQVVLALVLWIAGIVAVVRSRRSGETDLFWRGMLVVLWAVLPAAILAVISLREPLLLQRYMVFSLPATALLAALGTTVLRKWNIGLLLIIALCAMSLPSIYAQYHRPRENWRAAVNYLLSSAKPGDAVVFFPFYTRIMLDYYSDREGPAVPALHVFAPGYYAGGEDASTLLAALDRDPRQFRRIWVFVVGHDRSLQSFDNGSALADKLHTIYGSPAKDEFAEIDVLEYGR